MDFPGVFNRYMYMQPDAAVVPCAVFYRGFEFFFALFHKHNSTRVDEGRKR